MSRLVAALLPLFAAGCSVDRSVLDDRIFECRSDQDCTDGYGCELVNATAEGFCAQKVDEARDCDGFRTVDGLCLPECAPGEADACGSDLDCLSADVATGANGYCVPEQTCSSDEDCGEDMACMSTVVHDILGIFGRYEFGALADLSCVPRCAEGTDECPADTDCLLGYCMPKCGDDSECPLGFGCSAGVGSSVGLCLPGIPWLLTGIKCRDQSNCLMGSCTTFPFGTNDSVNYCALPCDEEPLCRGSREVDGRLNVRTCTEIPGIGEQCMFLSGYMGVCDPARDPINRNVDCVSGLSCTHLVDNQTQQEYDLCVAECVFDDAAPNLDRDGNCTDDAFCYQLDANGNGLCIYDLENDIGCERDEQCISQFCDTTATCEDQGQAPGCCAPAT